MTILWHTNYYSYCLYHFSYIWAISVCVRALWALWQINECLMTTLGFNRIWFVRYLICWINQKQTYLYVSSLKPLRTWFLLLNIAKFWLVHFPMFILFNWALPRNTNTDEIKEARDTRHHIIWYRVKPGPKSLTSIQRGVFLSTKSFNVLKMHFYGCWTYWH